MEEQPNIPGNPTIRISDFDYDLPPELIAQAPLEPRDASRLLVLNRSSGTLEHRHFRDIGEYLRPGDLLIANQSRVIPARLLGHRAQNVVAPLVGTLSGGQASRLFEVLLLAERRDLGPNYWETLVRPGRRLHEGDRVVFRDETNPSLTLHAEILQRTGAGGRIVHFSVPATTSLTVPQLIDQLGQMPLPPYIHATLNDPERYQTVYASIRGSAAAPTAGLHFTPHLLEQLQRQGVLVDFVTLHVGLDTFRPIESEDVSEHKMHSEEIELAAPTAKHISETRKAGGRVIAVGTTSVRVLEGVASMYNGHVEPYTGRTRLFITPGYRFQVVDAMITNFHLPRSTLLLLVSAFAGKALIEKAYQEAIRQRYRFYSFGDAMLIL